MCPDTAKVSILGQIMQKTWEMRLPVCSALSFNTDRRGTGESSIGRSKLVPWTDILSDAACTLPKLAKNVIIF